MLWQVDFFQSEVYEYLFDNKCIVTEFPTRITSSAFRNWSFQFVLFCIQFTTAKQERKEIRANTLQISQQMPRMLERYIDVKLDIVSYPPAPFLFTETQKCMHRRTGHTTLVECAPGWHEVLPSTRNVWHVYYITWEGCVTKVCDTHENSLSSFYKCVHSVSSLKLLIWFLNKSDSAVRSVSRMIDCLICSQNQISKLRICTERYFIWLCWTFQIWEQQWQ